MLVGKRRLRYQLYDYACFSEMPRFEKKCLFSDNLLDYMRVGDTLVIWKLSRLARSIRQIIATSLELEKREISLKVITQNIETGSPEGRLYFHITAAFDEFQRELIVENTRAGLAAAHKRGRKGGRPTSMTEDKIRKLPVHIRYYQATDICTNAISLGNSIKNP